jgi:translation initiation factor IF-3
MPMRKNGEIKAVAVRVIGPDGKQLGVFPTSEAIKMARNLGMDLVEIAPNATPPVARIVDVKKSNAKI